MHKSPVSYQNSFIATEIHMCMTSMMMLTITMEVNVNKSLPLKDRPQAKLGPFFGHLTSFRHSLCILAEIMGNSTLLDFGQNLLKTQNNLLDKCLI